MGTLLITGRIFVSVLSERHLPTGPAADVPKLRVDCTCQPSRRLECSIELIINCITPYDNGISILIDVKYGLTSDHKCEFLVLVTVTLVTCERKEKNRKE
jgi:hypothetical protein